jgi:transposase
LLTVDKHRGKEGIEKSGVLQIFGNVLMHDFWAPYFRFDGLIHAMCCEHLIRELTNRAENTDQKWPQQMIDLLLEMKKAKEDEIEKGKTAFTKNSAGAHKQVVRK